MKSSNPGQLLLRDSLPTLCGEHGGSVQQQLAKKHHKLGPGEPQRGATEVK